jgi:hypothetical protein
MVYPGSAQFLQVHAGPQLMGVDFSQHDFKRRFRCVPAGKDCGHG